MPLTGLNKCARYQLILLFLHYGRTPICSSCDIIIYLRLLQAGDHNLAIGIQIVVLTSTHFSVCPLFAFHDWFRLFHSNYDDKY